MARIRIVDEWLRSPVSPPSRHRAIMVVAERWAEQRVLMRAFQECRDQTRPTVVLHGGELAIGPAGTDPYGPWGIHVQPPADGAAQELRHQLELAAKRLAGVKGNPARLEDETSGFDGKRTNFWAPGTPPDTPSQAPVPTYYEPALVAPPDSSTAIPSAARHGEPAPAPAANRAAPHRISSSRPIASRRRRGWTSPIPVVAAREVGGRTAMGFAAAPVTQARSSGPSVALPGRKLARLVGKTMPVGFQLTGAERHVLNALGETPSLTARQIGQLIGVDDPLSWMEQLMIKLSGHGLDLVVPGDAVGGEPTYMLRR